LSLKLQNTLTRDLQPFVPLEEGRVGVYACGPTIYGPAHIGNFRTFMVYDLVHRYLEWSGYDVRFVMNFTDVDDKTIDAAAAEGLTIAEYTGPFADAILDDLDALGFLRFDAYPRATAYMAPMIGLVERLLEKGLAYTTPDGSVFFRISAFPGYGRLSGADPEAGRQGERVAADEYGKDDVRDFALWKGVKPKDEEVGAAWDAPWGRGRPGWHLECSAMSLSEIGDTLDIHLGGEDLVFPHHEDEIAQSEGATGKPFVRYWLHVKHLLLEGRKMSKSLGNTVTVRELLERGHDPAAIRHQLLSAQYRHELNFTMDGIDGSARAVRRLLDFEERLEGLVDDPEAAPTALPERAATLVDAFRVAMDDDLNTAEAFAALFVFVSGVNAELDRAKGRILAAERERALEALRSVDRVFGLLELGRRARAVDPGTERWIVEKIEERRAARASGDYDRADAVRAELAERGIALEDSGSDTRWKRVGTGAETPSGKSSIG
jgi:cysteinyl-tRNA synthetase